MSKVSDYELIDHGIDGSQYFQGCGTTFTRYSHCVTGIGDSPAEAIEDCLEQIACSAVPTGHTWDTIDVDVEELAARILSDEGWTEFPASPSVAEEYPAEEPCGDCDGGDDESGEACETCNGTGTVETGYSDELYYHVSIRYNVT